MGIQHMSGDVHGHKGPCVSGVQVCPSRKRLQGTDKDSTNQQAPYNLYYEHVGLICVRLSLSFSVVCQSVVSIMEMPKTDVAMSPINVKSIYMFDLMFIDI